MNNNIEKDIQEKVQARIGRMLTFRTTHVGHLLAKKGNRELLRLGITLQIEQLPILFVTYFAGEGLLSQQEIANLLQKDKSGILRSIRTLERDGYLKIVSDESDRRKNLIQLTPAGKLVVVKVIEISEKIDQEITDQLTPEELTTLFHILNKVTAFIES